MPESSLPDSDLREAVNGFATVTISESWRHGQPAAWSAELVGVGPFMVDGKWPRDLAEDDPLYDADEVAGFGRDRAAAIADLHTLLTRVTWAAVDRAGWDPQRDRPTFTHRVIAWSGTRLEAIPGEGATGQSDDNPESA